MPHPLAHPAAVFPLKRFCPRWLSFPALVIGSLSPDAGYFFGGHRVQEFSHELVGSVGFCLPMGLLMLGAFYGLRSGVVGFLPGPWRRVWSPSCQRPAGSWWTLVVSLLVGIWMHQFLDSVTHKDGWMAEHVAFLETPIVEWPLRLRGCHCIWYVLSFAGIIWMGMIYQQWLAGLTVSSKATTERTRLLYAVLLAALLMLVSVAYCFVYHWMAPYQEALLSCSMVGAFLVITRPRLDSH